MTVQTWQQLYVLELLADLAYHDHPDDLRRLAVIAEAWEQAGFFGGHLDVPHASAGEFQARVALARRGRPRARLRQDAREMVATITMLIEAGVLDGDRARQRRTVRWFDRGGHDRTVRAAADRGAGQ